MHTEQEIRAALGAIDGGRVLDVATGAGGMITWLIEDLKSYDTITGIDTVDIRERLNGQPSVFDQERITFRQMDAHAIDFPDASFDTVSISNSLHHMADPRRVVAEMGRVLKPGGWAILSEMVRDDLTEEQLTHMALHHWWARVDSALGITHNETFTRAELRALVGTMPLRELTVFEYADLESDPFDADTLATLRGHIDRYLERARDLPDFPAIQARGDALRQRLETTGIRWATGLVILGRA